MSESPSQGPSSPRPASSPPAEAPRRAAHPSQGPSPAAPPEDPFGRPRSNTAPSRPVTGPLPAAPRPSTAPSAAPRPSTTPPAAPRPSTAPPAAPPEDPFGRGHTPTPRVATTPPAAPAPPAVDAQVRALAAAQDEHERADFRAAAGLRRLRPLLAALVVAGALAGGLWPVFGEYAFVQEQARLAETLEAAKRDLESPALDGWLATRDLAALRKLYVEVRPRLVEAVKGAGFPAAAPDTVTLRLDDTGSALVLAAQFEREDGRPLAWSVPVGAGQGVPAAPAPRIGKLLVDAALPLAAWLTAALAACAALWWPRRRRPAT